VVIDEAPPVIRLILTKPEHGHVIHQSQPFLRSPIGAPQNQYKILLPSRGNEDLPTALPDSGSVVQAMQRAGLCGPHSATRLLVLSPCTLNDALQSILEVQLLSAFPFCPHIHITFGMKHEPGRMSDGSSEECTQHDITHQSHRTIGTSLSWPS